MPAELVRLTQILKAIQACRGQLPWRSLDLTMAQLKTVMLLCRMERAKNRDLADSLGIAPSAVTPLIDRMIEQKLVRRVDDESDRRIVWIHPTRKAQGIYDELLEMNAQVLGDVIEQIPRSDRKTVNHSIRLLAEAAARVLAKDKQG